MLLIFLHWYEHCDEEICLHSIFLINFSLNFVKFPDLMKQIHNDFQIKRLFFHISNYLKTIIIWDSQTGNVVR